MRLRTFESFWLLKNGLLHSYPSLQNDITTEIVVIGGGITGALISHSLLKHGYEVTLIDQNDICQGSTAATTAMLQYEIDVPLYELAKQIGEDAAATCYKAGIQAIDELGALVEEENLNCGFKLKQSLYFAHNNRAAKWLKKELEIRNKHELGVEWLTANEIESRYGVKCYGGILSQKAASMDAYKFAQDLIFKNSKRGLRVFDQTPVENIIYDDAHQEILLENGCKINSKHIVFCTGFETVSMFPEKTASLFSTFASVSEMGSNSMPALENTLVWNTDDPYLYMRTTDDGRFLIGGEDTKYNSGFLREKNKERKSKKLIKALSKVIPKLNFIEDFSWAGSFGSTKDGLPYIGKHEKYPGACFVLGFGGNGITFSVQGMKLIIKLLEGEADELLNYYRFGR